MTSGYDPHLDPGTQPFDPGTELPGPRHAAPDSGLAFPSGPSGQPTAFADQPTAFASEPPPPFGGGQPGDFAPASRTMPPLPSRAGFVPPWASAAVAANVNPTAVDGPASAPDDAGPASAAPPGTALPAPGPAVTASGPAGPRTPNAAAFSAPPAPGQPSQAAKDGPGSWAPPVDQARRVVPPPRRAWPAVTALLLAVALAGLAGFQAYQINQLTSRLADADQRLTEAQDADASRFDLVESRTAELERQVGAAFNPESIAAAALPSVFRVTAGRFTGTAFAIGEPGPEGTNLLTNYHVVEPSYLAGSRRVFLERDGERIEAAIVAVDEESDVAQLRTTRSFAGLVPAAEAVRSGQQIVVVGAPLGLADTVTTGVVSALRQAEDGPGPVLQFDAPINPGNSGGPVINSSTQVVGIATAKARDAEGIGLAVPIQVACAAFDIC